MSNRRAEVEGRLERARGRLVGGLAAAMAVFFVLPVAALVWRAVVLGSGLGAIRSALFSAVVVSLGTTAVAVGLILLLGTPLAYVMARHSFRLRPLVSIFIELPIVMPPVVAGLALLAAFGRRGLIGAPLAEIGVAIPFTAAAVVLAQVFVSAPFYIRAAQSRFASLPREFEDAAAVDGANRWMTFWLVMLPQSAPALLSGLILAWARALGEFGATILFAGSLAGRTQTMPLLVYAALEQDLNLTYATALVLLGLAALAFALTRRLAHLEEQESADAAA